MPDEMFFENDSQSLRRGRRRAPRTEACRPCLVWAASEPATPHKGVVLDLSPYGLRIRMLDYLPPGAHVRIQFMRDEDFQSPIGIPLDGMIVRTVDTDEGFMEYGVDLQRDIGPKPARRRSAHLPSRRPPAAPRPAPESRMHTIDIILSDRGPRRPEK